MPKAISPSVKRFVRKLALGGMGPADIYHEMEFNKDFYNHALPTLRTVEMWVNKIRKEEDLSEWRLEDCENPEDAQIVFEEYFGMIWTNKISKFTLTKKFASAIIRIKKACPSLPKGVPSELAFMYLDGNHIQEIFLLLAFKPFEGPGRYAFYTEHLKDRYSDDWKRHAIYKRLTKIKPEKSLDVGVPHWDYSLNAYNLPVLEIPLEEEIISIMAQEWDNLAE